MNFILEWEDCFKQSLPYNALKNNQLNTECSRLVCQDDLNDKTRRMPEYSERKI